MALSSIQEALRDTWMDAADTEIDSGAGAGLLEIWSGVAPATFTTKLATLTFTTPNPFGASSGGVITAAAISDDASADATGTAALGKVTTSDPTLVFNFTVGTSGEDLNLNSVSITAADVVSISSMTLTAPAA